MSCSRFAVVALVFLLVSSAGYSAEGADNIVAAAGEFLKRAPLSETERRDILDGISSFPERTDWILSGDGRVYSIAMRRVQKDSRENVQNKLGDMSKNIVSLRARSLLYLRAAPLSKKSAYRSGDFFAGALVAWDDVSNEAERLKLSGSVSMLSDDWAFAMAIASDTALGELSRRVEAADPRALDVAYCSVLYPRAKELFDEERFEDALPYYRELHSLKWAKPAVYMEAAECFVGAGKTEDALKLLTETLSELEPDMDSVLIERTGDLLLEFGDEAGAERAYRQAVKKMKDEG
jgi:tetratricopeptide (TPR) repeat protein